MKKVLLIGDSPIGDGPYVGSYIEILEKNNIPYDLLFWNRHLVKIDSLPSNYIPYNCYTDIRYPSWRRVLKIIGFTRFAKRQMIKTDYAFIVVFTIAYTVFLNKALLKYYGGRYIFDIRDYSPIYGMKVFHNVVNKLIENSSLTVVSSAGFLKWLPRGDRYRYQVAHNTNLRMIKDYYEKRGEVFPSTDDIISILTIGQIRDFEANSILLDRLKNIRRFKMVFSGVGVSSDSLKEYTVKNNIENAFFTGRYNKSDEVRIVSSHHMVNVFLNRDLNSDTLMTNRFYLSVLLRKPMISNEGSFQSELIKKYGLGVTLNEGDSFVDVIDEWWRNFNRESYEKGCHAFIERLKFDMESFENNIVRLYSKNDSIISQ